MQMKPPLVDIQRDHEAGNKSQSPLEDRNQAPTEGLDAVASDFLLDLRGQVQV
jgi:hypothetical protein